MSRSALNHADLRLDDRRAFEAVSQQPFERPASAARCRRASDTSRRPAARTTASAARSARRSRAAGRRSASGTSTSGATRPSSISSHSVTSAAPRVSGSGTSARCAVRYDAAGSIQHEVAVADAAAGRQDVERRRTDRRSATPAWAHGRGSSSPRAPAIRRSPLPRVAPDVDRRWVPKAGPVRRSPPGRSHRVVLPEGDLRRCRSRSSRSAGRPRSPRRCSTPRDPRGSARSSSEMRSGHEALAYVWRFR